MEEPENYIAEYEEYLRGLPQPKGRKLSFSEQCGIAWALKNGERADTIKEAFGLSGNTISMLKRCLQGGSHYPQVRAEYESLGPALFKEKYFTRELWARLWRIGRNRPDLDFNQTDKAPRFRGPNPDADTHKGRWKTPDDLIWEIAWVADLNSWAVRSIDYDGPWHGAEWPRGLEEFHTLRTSGEAYRLLLQVTQFESDGAVRP